MTTVVITPVARPEQATLFQLGEDVPTPSAGIARWELIQRPRRRSLTDYDGEDPLKLKFDVLLNEYPDGDVEPMVRRVMAWAARTDLPYEPTTLKISGPLPYADLTYILTGVDHTDLVAFRSDNRRCRQQLRLELTEYVPASSLTAKPPPPAEAAQQRIQARSFKGSLLDNYGKREERTYTVKSRDTLSGIAASLLGKASRWPEIATLNNVRDPRTLRIGQVLKIPQ